MEFMYSGFPSPIRSKSISEHFLANGIKESTKRSMPFARVIRPTQTKYLRGKISVDDAQNHRLHLVIVDEVTANGDAGIHNEADAVNGTHRIALMYDGGNKIRTAGIGAGFGKDRKYETLNDTAHQRA